MGYVSWIDLVRPWDTRVGTSKEPVRGRKSARLANEALAVGVPRGPVVPLSFWSLAGSEVELGLAPGFYLGPGSESWMAVWLRERGVEPEELVLEEVSFRVAPGGEVEVDGPPFSEVVSLEVWSSGALREAVSREDWTALAFFCRSRWECDVCGRSWWSARGDDVPPRCLCGAEMAFLFPAEGERFCRWILAEVSGRVEGCVALASPDVEVVRERSREFVPGSGRVVPESCELVEVSGGVPALNVVLVPVLRYMSSEARAVLSTGVFSLVEEVGVTPVGTRADVLAVDVRDPESFAVAEALSLAREGRTFWLEASGEGPRWLALWPLSKVGEEAVLEALGSGDAEPEGYEGAAPAEVRRVMADMARGAR